MKKMKQTGKKVLSVFLAVLMVMTAWVFVAPEKASAAENIYTTNIAEIQKVKTDLVNINSFSQASTFPNDSGNYPSGTFANVVWAGTAKEVAGISNVDIRDSDALEFFKVFYIPVVLMDDGTNDAYFPVSIIKDAKKGCEVRHWGTAISGTNLSFKNSNWYGVVENRYNEIIFNDVYNASNKQCGLTYTGTANESSFYGGSKGAWFWMANVIAYKGGSLTGSTYSATITPSFSTYVGQPKTTTKKAKNVTASVGSANTPIYVIRTGTLKTALAKATAVYTEITNNYSKYTTESVREFVELANALLECNPNNYTWGTETATQVAKYAEEAKAAVDAWNAWGGLREYRAITFDNLFSYNKFTIGGNLTLNERTDEGFTVTSTAPANDPDGNTGFSYAIPVESGKTYVLSADVDLEAVSGGYDIYINTLNANSSGIQDSVVDTTNGAGKEGDQFYSLTGQTTNQTPYIRLTIGNNTKYIKIRFDANYPGNKLTVNNIRLYNETDLSDVSFVHTKLYDHGAVVDSTLPVPTRTGHTFNCWYLDSNSNGKKDSGEEFTDSNGNVVSSRQNLAITEDYALRSDWTIHKFNITWKNNDGSVIHEDKDVPYGTTPSYDGPTPTKQKDNIAHYTFDQWRPTISPVTGNATYTANFNTIPHSYTEKVVEEVYKMHNATCQTPKTYYYSCTCGQSSANATMPADRVTFTVGSTIDHILEFKQGVAANCFSDGQKDHYRCSMCGKIFADKEGKVEWTEADLVIKTPGCSWVDATCQMPKHCSICNTTDGLPLAHEDKDGDHICDNGCNERVSGSDCVDADKDHYCDFEKCDTYFGTHADSPTDNDHLCDYGCGVVLEDCSDSKDDKDHMCDVCGKVLEECSDSKDDNDHECDVCGKVLEECSDKAGDGDHKCDVCGKDNITNHTFIENPVKEYEATPATCNQSATYYESCSECGEKGTEIFAYGKPSGIHSYSFKNIKDKFKVSDATCKEYAVYYYSCTCEAIGTETFEYVEGGYAPHVLTHHDADPGEMPCKVNGKIEYWSCDVCDKLFSDADGINEITDITAPLVAHTPGEAKTENEVPATCAKDGSYDEVIYCSVCSVELSRERKTTQATGTHAYNRRVATDATKATDATCSVQATYYYSCACGAFITEGETFAYGSTAPHIFTKKIETNDYKKSDATCTEKATYYYACTTCEIKGTTTYEHGELADHTKPLVKHDAVEATCAAAGSNEYYSCSACKKCFKDAEGKTATTVEAETIAKLNHKWTAHHDYDSVLTEATCQTAAVYNKHCDNCKAKLYGNNITYTYGEADETAHKFDGAVINNGDKTHSFMCSVEGCTECGSPINCTYEVTFDVASTCKTAGYKTYECKACSSGYSETKLLDTNNHTGEGTYTIGAQASTCATYGSTGVEKCVGCDTTLSEKLNDLPIDPNNHGEYMIDYDGVEATCQTPGYTAYRYCSACDTYEIEKEPVEKKAHKFTTYTSNGDDTHTATCDTCEGDNKAKDTQSCSGGIANCVDKKVCTVCKTAYGDVDATNHKEITVIPQVDPTCQVKGKTSYQKCVCGVVIKEAEDIDTVPHVYGKWQKLEGETNKHIRYCVNCVDTDTLDIASDDDYCSGGTAYCNKLASCAGCGEEYGTYNPSKHSSKETVIKNAVEATCTSEGNTGDVYYKCCYSDKENADNSNALKSEGEVIPKLAHDFSVEVKVETKSTCSVKGTATYKCSNCEETATKQLPLDKNNHSDMKNYDAQEATCQADGWEAYKYCKDCGTYEVAKVTVPAKPHTYKKYESNGDSTHSATCTTCEGTEKAVDTVACSGGTAYCTEKAVCKVCNAEYGSVNIANHKETITVEGTKATCQTKGTTAHEVCTACKKTVGEVTETPKLPHEYSEWKKVEGKDQHSRYCTKCVDDPSKNLVVDVQTENCSGGVAYCDALAECTVCKTKYGSVNAANHREYETVPEVPATCQSEGTKAYEKCTKCGAPKAQPEKIAQLAHTFTKYTATADGTHTATCDTCEGENKATDVQNCSGGTATCKKLAECSVCGQEYGSLNAENHEGETTVVGKVDATCQNTGYSGDIYYACCYDKDAADNSGALKEAGKATDILEHSYTIKLSETLATCRATGSATYKCSTCVETDTVKAATDEVTLPIDKNNHASEEVLVIGKLDPTCTTEGYSGDKYHACCYESNKTTSLIQKGYKLSATGVHNYGTAIPEYLVEYTRDADGKVIGITAKEDNLSYEEKIEFRDADDNKWKHVQICADCYEIKESNCYTYNHTSTCTTTDSCEICKGLCSLVNPKNHGGNLILIPAVPATGNTPGTIAHYKCNACKKLFFDEAGQKQVENLKDLEIEVTIEHEINEQIPAKPNGNGTHNYTCGHCGEPIVEDCSGGTATCQSKAECSICGQKYGEIDEKNHISDEVVIVGKKDATCSDSGYTGDAYYKCCYVEGAADNSKALKAKGKEIPNDPSLHVMKLRDNLDGTHTEYCEGCGTYELAPVAHIWVAGNVPETASCTEGYDLGYTCICGATKTEHVDAKGHDYAETSTEKAATCTAAGEKTTVKTCKVCGDTAIVKETIAALGHDKRTIKGVPATCSTNGSTDYIYCNRCDVVIQDTTVIPATGCVDTNNDGYCDSCGEYLRTNEDGSNCGCICHKKNGLMQFFYKILNFFWKLFKIEKTCDCGTVTHW